MTIDYVELKRLAEAATPGRHYDRLDSAGGGLKYECTGDDGSLVLRVDHKNNEFGFIGDRGEEDEAFFLACTPATILALIAEVEGLRTQINEADRLLGAAERRAAKAEESERYASGVLDTQEKWLSDAVRDMGYPAHEVFDVVWADTRRDALRYRYIAPRISASGYQDMAGFKVKSLEDVHACIDAAMGKEASHG